MSFTIQNVNRAYELCQEAVALTRMLAPGKFGNQHRHTVIVQRDGDLNLRFEPTAGLVEVLCTKRLEAIKQELKDIGVTFP